MSNSPRKSPLAVEFASACGQTHWTLMRRWTMWAGVAAWLLLTVSCVAQTGELDVDLRAKPQTATATSLAPPSKNRLVLAVAAVNSPMSTFKGYSDLVNYLASKLDMEGKFVGGKTYAEINSLIRSGDVNLAIVCSGAYIYGHDEFNLELLAAPVIKGQSVYYSYLIVGKDSSIDGWNQLRERTFAFTDPLSNSGRLVPLYQIWQMGKTPESLFSKYIFTYSHEKSIKAVAGRLVDAASVDSLVYDYVQTRGEDDASKTKVIWRSPPYAMNPVVVNPNLDPSLKAKLRKILLEMDSTDEGRHILSALQFDRFTSVSDGDYDSIRRMARAVDSQGAP